jgi:hypothetical protein
MILFSNNNLVYSRVKIRENENQSRCHFTFVCFEWIKLLALTNQHNLPVITYRNERIYTHIPPHRYVITYIFLRRRLFTNPIYISKSAGRNIYIII